MKIFKYGLKLTNIQRILMPIGAEILTAQMQGQDLNLWVKVDEKAKAETRTIGVFGTGHPIPENTGKFIATVQMNGGQFIWHVFDLTGVELN